MVYDDKSSYLFIIALSLFSLLLLPSKLLILCLLFTSLILIFPPATLVIWVVIRVVNLRGDLGGDITDFSGQLSNPTCGLVSISIWIDILIDMATATHVRGPELDCPFI